MKKNVQCREKKQKGAAAIEFAFVFPVFFLIFYGIVTYGIIFVAQQSITLAAAEGARAALRFATTDTVREANARYAAIGTGSAAAWLGTRLTFEGLLLASCPYGATGIRCYRVTVSYQNYRQNPLVPLILGSLMSVAVPERLSSTAVVQID
ncbi:TadE-like protein [compost metagenome]